MDLSNLSSNLPATTPLEAVSLPSINEELTDEFKSAAKSVASLYNAQKSSDTHGAKAQFASAAKSVAALYRLGTTASVLLLHKGYLDCLDDLLHVIANNEDIENWALTRRAELTNHYNKELPKEGAAENACELDSSEFVLPTDHEFSFPLDLALGVQFRPSLAAPSVTYKRTKKKTTRKLPPAAEASSESDDSDEPVKRKLAQQLLDSVKRRRRDLGESE